VHKKIFALFVIFISVFVLSACRKKVNNNEKVGVAYGITHSDYIGVATVKVENDVVSDASFEEYYLPNTWAKVKTLEVSEVPEDVIVDGTTWYGKYLVIGSKRFVGALRTEPLVLDGKTYSKQTVRYSSEGINDLFVWLYESEENRKWYVNELEKGNAYVATSDYSKAGYETAGMTTSEGKLGFKKSITGYWQGDNYPLGWKGNMAAIVEVIKGTKVDVSLDDIKKNENNKWVVGNVVSGATLTDFKDYYKLAKEAYNKAVSS